MISGMRKDILVAGFLLSIIDRYARGILCAYLTGNGTDGRRECKCSLTLRGETPNETVVRT